MTKNGGTRGKARIGLMITVAIALVASMFTIQQVADAKPLVPVDDVAVVTMSAPEECTSPFWEYQNSDGVAHIEDPYARTTDAYLFDAGHSYFRVTCADGNRFRFKVTGPTATLEDRIEEMRWTHRGAKCAAPCEVFAYHPSYVTAGLPDAGYVDPISWADWRAEAISQGFGSQINFALMDEFAERELIGAAMLLVDEQGFATVRIAHINH